MENLKTTDTAAAVVHVCMKVLLTESLCKHFNLLWGEAAAREITQSSIRNEFLATFNTLTHRLGVHEPADLFDKEYRIHGVMCDPYHQWLSGLNIALSAWTWYELWKQIK